MSMSFVYPADYFKPHQPDSTFKAEVEAVSNLGLSVFSWNGQKFSPALAAPLRPFYRGWMLTLADYQALYAAWAKLGILARTSPEHYALTHYLPNWYALLADWTPETVRIKFPEELSDTLENLGWDAYFLKDDVKSLKTGAGSRLNSASESERWLKEMKHFRGQIEGGICIRRWESWLPETEQRWFVLQEKPFGPVLGQAVPEPVKSAVTLIDSPFFSVDVVQNTQGQWRIVELGDGQVSDWVGWAVADFAAIFKA
jgi:hypothetical protein